MAYLLKAGFKDVTKGEVYQHIRMIRQGSVDENPPHRNRLSHGSKKELRGAFTPIS